MFSFGFDESAHPLQACNSVALESAILALAPCGKLLDEEFHRAVRVASVHRSFSFSSVKLEKPFFDIAISVSYDERHVAGVGVGLSQSVAIKFASLSPSYCMCSSSLHLGHTCAAFDLHMETWSSIPSSFSRSDCPHLFSCSHIVPHHVHLCLCVSVACIAGTGQRLRLEQSLAKEFHS